MNTVSVVTLFATIGLFSCLKCIPERANVTYFNTKYIEYGRLYISRYSRKSPYYINLEGRIKDTWGNNVTANLIFFEYLHNEYRRSFVEVHMKFCEMVGTDPYIGGMLKRHGVTCPAPPNEYHLMNMTISAENFPNVFPFTKAKVEVEVTLDTGETLFKAYAIAMFKAPIKKKTT